MRLRHRRLLITTLALWTAACTAAAPAGSTTGPAPSLQTQIVDTATALRLTAQAGTAAPAEGTPAPEAAFVEYQHPVLGFSLRYPAGWAVSDAACTDPQSRAGSGVEIRRAGSSVIAGGVLVRLAQRESLAASIDYGLEPLGALAGGVARRDTLLGGLPAVELTGKHLMRQGVRRCDQE